MPPSLIPKNCSSVLSSSQSSCRTGSIRVAQPVRNFSASTTNQGRTRLRRMMYSWLNGPGEKFREPLEGSSNYMGAYRKNGILKRAAMSPPGAPLLPPFGDDLKPFVKNDNFVSQPVTSEALREEVWEKIMKNGLSVKEVSIELGVEMSRVGAIVRLKEVEKAWQRQGKRLAKPYSKAIMQMLPHSEPSTSKPFESISDLPVHAATQQQIFYPTSESRQFTRVDAARVFADGLLPADLRVPHPELIEDERLRLQGVGYKDIAKRAEGRSKAAYEKKVAADEKKRAREAAALKVVPGVRWDFKFREISVDAAGANGRGKDGTGWRYGVPLYDRRRGEVKIPTRVA
ncbi:hypothetical protein V494_03417 [Pseudogymnoascus sp. VKM F-4513 (FW-928)]|nr:hypothetical protein V494_03417 [Pseudogymnoascus sp. VKM F-4513 (FW-928)]